MTILNYLSCSVLRKSWFSTELISNRQLEINEFENEFLVGGTELNTLEFDRPQYFHEYILTHRLDARQCSPLARHITEIIS
jgi:hypothetical protein